VVHHFCPAFRVGQRQPLVTAAAPQTFPWVSGEQEPKAFTRAQLPLIIRRGAARVWWYTVQHNQLLRWSIFSYPVLSSWEMVYLFIT